MYYCASFIVIVPFHVLQSSAIVDLLHSRVNTPLPVAVSLHNPNGSP
jgi:hypothetical protein